MANCKQCSQAFKITERDRDFYQKLKPAIPEPKLCPTCRQKGRLAFYNRRQLYKRKCDFTGKEIVSIYSPDKPFAVYDKDIWFSDKWDATDYGRDFDFNRPFFEQFREHMENVPQLSLILLGENINSDFTNDNYKLKNCYLVFDGSLGEDSYYGESYVGVKDSCDFLFLEQSELCYEVVNCTKCYNLKFSRFCKNCSDSWFLRDCISCRNCFGCAGLRQKEYYIFNEKHTKAQYEKFMKEFRSGGYKALLEMKQKIEAFHLTRPVKALHGIQNENVIGDNLNHCKNAFWCFDSNYLQDCEYVSDDQTGASDCWDIDIWGEAIELCYNSCVIGMNLRNVICGFYVSEGGYNIYYSTFCSRNSNNLFGCIGLRHKQYCIFNKQYRPAEYEKTVSRIVEHMKKTGEWGEFFPPEISAFGYNETIAYDHYPMTKEEVLQKKWRWKDLATKLPDVKNTVSASEVADHIDDVPDEMANSAVMCAESGRPFRITSQELRFYKNHQVPLPRLHPDVRHRNRMALRNPHQLWKRQCRKCHEEIETSFAPERPEIIYCEKCYLDMIE